METSVGRNKRSALRRRRESRVTLTPSLSDFPPRRATYINPVKHGLVTRVRDWPHSSFHRDVRTCFRSIGRATCRQRAASASVFEMRRNELRLLRRVGWIHGRPIMTCDSGGTMEHFVATRE
jgi:hypothetical protein